MRFPPWDICVVTVGTITQWSRTWWWDFRPGRRGRPGGPCTCLFLRDGGCTEADSDDDDGSEPAEDEGKVEVVEVLEHGWPPVHLPTGWGRVAELQDHAHKPHPQAEHEPPEGSLWREDRPGGGEIQVGDPRKLKVTLPSNLSPPAGYSVCTSIRVNSPLMLRLCLNVKAGRAGTGNNTGSRVRQTRVWTLAPFQSN